MKRKACDLILVAFIVFFVVMTIRCFSSMVELEPEQMEVPREFPAVEIVPMVVEQKPEIVAYEAVPLVLVIDTPELLPEVLPEKLPEVDPAELEMLACVIYQEAGGDNCCDECRYRVADVVLNRVNDPRFPNTIKEVLEEPRQWGLFSETGITWSERASLPEEQEAVARAYDIAYDVLSGNHSDLTSRYIWCAEFAQGTDWVYCDGIYFGRG